MLLCCCSLLFRFLLLLEWGGRNSKLFGIQHSNLYEKIILVKKLDCCVINSTVKLYSSKHSAALLTETYSCSAFETEGFFLKKRKKKKKNFCPQENSLTGFLISLSNIYLRELLFQHNDNYLQEFLC